MMEVTLPEGAGPPPHHHDWDEACDIADGRVRFHLDGAMREVGRKVRLMPQDGPKVPAIGLKHGIHFLPMQG